ncbi:hypothetical protein K2173_012265 [Erythroxylum novogranatense]|uniref:Uncharacterized protein n=1 Tax=Erythroxylum novogranatense TaxID=1862640 RepID=A0AAV8SCD7_9ROSI|nr:hypothetical protein K2173_012265 [Erythroxylum novogranatense]
MFHPLSFPSYAYSLQSLQGYQEEPFMPSEKGIDLTFEYDMDLYDHLMVDEIEDACKWMSDDKMCPPLTELLADGRSLTPILPYGRFAHFAANSAIVESIPRDADVVHIVELEDLVSEAEKLKHRGRNKWLIFNCMVGFPHMGKVRPTKQVVQFLKIARKSISLLRGA